MESELLPPTRATLLPHIQRTNFVCLVQKSYITTHPKIPSLTNNGWKLVNGEVVPVRCLELPAPQAVLELIKCCCKTSNCTQNCSCSKNDLPCTPLCKCYGNVCENANNKVSEFDIQDE